MRTQFLTVCAFGALLAAAFSFAPGQSALAATPPQVGGDAQMMALQAEVKTLSKEVETLKAFVEAQADAGKELMDAVARSEAEGFTAGMNPRSKELLLAGLKAQAKAMQSGSDDKETDKGKSGSKRGSRRDRQGK